MTLAVARPTFVSVRAETALARNGGALTMALPMASSTSLSCTFAAESRRAIFITRASDLEQGSEVEVAEDAPAAAAPAVQQGSKLYIGNLPWSCDSTQLAEICQDIGEVELAEVIYDRDSGRSKGFAFVTMASGKDAQAVIDALDGTDLGGRVLKVNYPQSQADKPRFERGERREDRRPSRRFEDPNKLFVGNLTWACDEVALETLFADFGKVVEAKIVTDRETGRSRGFGFVTLADASEVNNAIQNLDGAEYDGRQLRVNLAGDKPPPRPQFD